MKALAILLVTALIAASAFAAAKLPATITMKSGAVLRNVSVVRWQGADTVVLKHAGGTDPIRLEYLSPQSRAALEAYRDDSEKEGQATANASPSSVSGEVFVVTKGKSSIKLGAVTVSVYANTDAVSEAEALQVVSQAIKNRPSAFGPDPVENQNRRIHEAWVKYASQLPKGNFSTVTDGDGHFTVSTKGLTNYIIVVCDSRLIGTTYEHYLWIIQSKDITDPKNLILGNQNLIDIP